MGYKVAAIRHPMPYGDLVKQAVQRFATYDDLDKHECTIEEREEYEPHIDNGVIVYAGVDYEQILRQAEKEVDIILWDGGNNDFSFYVSDLQIVVADPHRPGHEMHLSSRRDQRAHGRCVRDQQGRHRRPADVSSQVRENLRQLNPNAIVIEAASPLFVDDPAAIRGKRVLVIEDGPTLTHGEMAYGAGYVAARRFGAARSSTRAPSRSAPSPPPTRSIPRPARSCRPWATATRRCTTWKQPSTRPMWTWSSSARPST